MQERDLKKERRKKERRDVEKMKRTDWGAFQRAEAATF